METVLVEPSSFEINMHIINIHDAKTHLSSLVEQAVKGDSFIIAKRGKPLVKKLLVWMQGRL